MSIRFRSIALGFMACVFGALLPGLAVAGDLDGSYTIREGDEVVKLDHIITDPTSGNEVYTLHCGGIFTSSSGRLVYDPTTGDVWVSVNPVRNPLDLALQGEGNGKAGPGRTIVIDGLKLDRQKKRLHFD